jgi:hypothetical protein
MSNPNKAKGTKWESDSRDTLAEFFGGRFGLRPHRPHQEGPHDVGDLGGIPPFAVQNKNYGDIVTALNVGLAGAEKQKAHAGQDYAVALIKRPRKSVGQGYAVMSIETWARLVLRLARAENLAADQPACEPAEWLADEAAADLARPFPRP